MAVTILLLRIIRVLVWKKRGDDWSWARYESVLYEIYLRKLERLADKSAKKLRDFYEFLSYGGYPENPISIEQEYLDLINEYCNGSRW